MGSCISKCRPKTVSEEECENVQDKLVISLAPTSPISVLDIKPPSPSPSHSTSSFSSFSCTTSNTSSSCSSSSSSSVLSSKDRSFSNEFLWACVKENPHVICTDPIKESPVKSVSGKFHAPKLVSPAKSSVVVPAKQLMPQRVVGSTPQKRVRASSPVLVRQKSFRREPERPNSAYSLPSRTLRSSPSPSRRFEGDKCRGMLANAPQESVCKRSTSPKGNAVNSSLSSVRKGSVNLRPPSPNNNSSRHPSCLRNREMGSQPNVGSKIGEIAVGEVLSNLGIDSLPTEDIDNPLISLDCFMFL